MVVEYSLADSDKPIGVSTYELKLPRELPSPKELEEKLTALLQDATPPTTLPGDVVE